MKIAIPVANNQISGHFGHCEMFVFFTVDQDKKEVAKQENLIPPAHQPGVLPKWIKEQNTDLLLVGGIGQKALVLFEKYGVKVLEGIETITPTHAIEKYLNGTLEVSGNSCDH